MGYTDRQYGETKTASPPGQARGDGQDGEGALVAEILITRMVMRRIEPQGPPAVKATSPAGSAVLPLDIIRPYEQDSLS